MAGETTQGDELNDIPVEYKGYGPDVIALDKAHEVQTGELEAGDTIEIGTVPDGAVLLDGFIATDDLDSDGTPALTLKVGTSGDDDGLLEANNVGQDGGVARFDGQFLIDRETVSGKTKILLTVDTAAATAQAGTARVVVYYSTP